jgi:hypothetical protein
MSDTSQGPGWWLASDGKWYPPELWTGPPASGPTPNTTPTAPPASPGGPPQAPLSGPVTAPPSPTGGAVVPGPSVPGTAPSGAGPYGPGQYGPGSYGQYPGYGQYQSYGSPRAPKTNGLAIASLICSCAGLFFLPIFPGIILGFVARSQIKRSNGSQKGDGLAVAGIIVGFGWLVLLALGIALSARNSSSSGIVSSLFAVPCCGAVGPVN